MSKNITYSFKRTLPIMAGFFPLGLAYGILMENAGYNFIWSGLTSITVLTGSLQFLMIDFFINSTPLISVLLMALLLNSRHIFYGLSFLEKFKSYGPWKYFLIWCLADENYSLLCSTQEVEGTKEEKINIISTSFVVFYWILFSILGGLIGKLITFDTTGIDFALTALFVVILVDQIRAAKSRLPVILAAFSSILCIILFGPSNFIFPSLLLTVALLIIMRARLEPTLNTEGY